MAAASSTRRISACAAAPCGTLQRAAAAREKDPCHVGPRAGRRDAVYQGLQNHGRLLLDTSFTYELGLISKLLGVVRRQFTLEGHNAELWDETARRFEHVAPLELELLPEDSMLREFYGGAADRRAQNADV